MQRVGPHILSLAFGVRLARFALLVRPREEGSEAHCGPAHQEVSEFGVQQVVYKRPREILGKKDTQRLVKTMIYFEIQRLGIESTPAQRNHALISGKRKACAMAVAGPSQAIAARIDSENTGAYQ